MNRNVKQKKTRNSFTKIFAMVHFFLNTRKSPYRKQLRINSYRKNFLCADKIIKKRKKKMAKKYEKKNTN